MWRKVFKGVAHAQMLHILSHYLPTLTPDKKYTVEVKEYREKRSLDANAYFWVLCDKLAAEVGIPKEEVYRNAIREIGGVSRTGCFKTGDVEELCRMWAKKGLGWFTETMPSKIEGCTNIIFYKGSSEYDTKQMARLIDNIVQDCQAVGIETETPENLERLVEAYAPR